MSLQGTSITRYGKIAIFSSRVNKTSSDTFSINPLCSGFLPKPITNTAGAIVSPMGNSGVAMLSNDADVTMSIRFNTADSAGYMDIIIIYLTDDPL